MKKLFIFVSAVFTSFACQDEVIERYKVQEPVYMSYADLRQAVKTKSASEQEFKNPGKIYYWNNYLFVNEAGKGIHVIDDSDPANPVFKTFINIPGNVDMAIKDAVLYADSYVDLVAIDISDMNNINEIARLDSIFPYIVPDLVSQYPMGQVDTKKGVVLGYQEVYVEQELYKVETNYYPRYALDKKMISSEMSWSGGVTSNSSGTGSGSGIGIGGSMARFTIAENALYAINQNSQILIFNIEQDDTLKKVGELTVSWGIETLFPYNGKLFIGSQTGMIIYDLANPFQPQFITNYQHVRSCDPVVVDGDFAYITLRTGTRCFGNINRLDIVNISNISAPYEIKTYDMTNPHGLGIDSSTLFLCDGEAGLKIFDVTDKTKLHENMIAQYPENKAFDVIPLGGVLLMVGEKGLYQYDYNNLQEIKLLSKIEIQ